jgi:SAM-dependent methyltransferase
MQVLADGVAREAVSRPPGGFDLRRSYDRYYETGLYDRRYPVSNRRILELILSELGPAGGRVLDFGCGSGRYALPLAALPGVEVFGYDVSAAAIQELRRRAAWAALSGARLDLLCGTLADLERRLQDDPGFDAVILLFGVLGHIEGRKRRIHVLRTLRARLRPGGRLIVTVPNRARRFHAAQRRRQGAPGGAPEPGDIRYWRGDDSGEPIELYYHLYSPGEFRDELAASGFAVSRLEPESVLPERAVLRSRCGAALDAALCRVLPVELAYGFVAVAQPDGAAETGLVDAGPAAVAA